MDFDRRHLLAGIGGLTLAGCSRAQGPAPPLPNRVDWTSFKARFLDASGRIIDNGNGGVSHSEGQSYGLILALRAGDRESFDRIFRWTEEKLLRPDINLYSWRYDPRLAEPVADRNNATDGDLLIAYALALAAARWNEPRYGVRSAGIRDALANRLVRVAGDRMLLLPALEGFTPPGRTIVNPAYYIWPALDAFARIDRNGPWRRIIADGEAMLIAARFGAHQLPADWVDVTDAGAFSPASGKPPRFGFDAIRVPLYASATGRAALVEPVRTWWRTMPQDRIPAWADVVSGQVADYPLSVGGQAIVSRTLGTKPPAILATDYYAAALQCLTSAF